MKWFGRDRGAESEDAGESEVEPSESEGAEAEAERRRAAGEVGRRWSGLSGDWPQRTPRQL